jgi:hypothetical protein
MAVIHYVAAACLFTSFACFAFFQFPRSIKTQQQAQESVPDGKPVRNTLYYICGAFIVFCMAWAAIGGLQKVSIFVPETLALEFFAFTWLIKGRAEITVVAVAQKTAHYARHPGQLVDKARNALRPKPGAGAPPAAA